MLGVDAVIRIDKGGDRNEEVCALFKEIWVRSKTNIRRVFVLSLEIINACCG